MLVFVESGGLSVGFTTLFCHFAAQFFEGIFFVGHFFQVLTLVAICWGLPFALAQVIGIRWLVILIGWVVLITKKIVSYFLCFAFFPPRTILCRGLPFSGSAFVGGFADDISIVIGLCGGFVNQLTIRSSGFGNSGPAIFIFNIAFYGSGFFAVRGFIPRGAFYYDRVSFYLSYFFGSRGVLIFRLFFLILFHFFNRIRLFA